MSANGYNFHYSDDQIKVEITHDGENYVVTFTIEGVEKKTWLYKEIAHAIRRAVTIVKWEFEGFVDFDTIDDDDSDIQPDIAK